MLRSKLKDRVNESKDTYIKCINNNVRLNRMVNMHIVATSVLGKSQNHSRMFANLILRTNIREVKLYIRN